MFTKDATQYDLIHLERGGFVQVESGQTANCIITGQDWPLAQAARVTTSYLMGERRWASNVVNSHKGARGSESSEADGQAHKHTLMYVSV